MSYGKKEVVQLLASLNIPYEKIEHAPVFTMEEMAQLKMEKQSLVAKNLFVRDDKKRNYYLICVNEKKTVNLKEMRTKIGSKPLSFANENDLQLKLKLQKGAVSPFGVLNDEECRVKVIIDAFFSGGEIGVHPNENTATVWIKTQNLIDVIKNHGNLVEIVEV